MIIDPVGVLFVIWLYVVLRATAPEEGRIKRKGISWMNHGLKTKPKTEKE
jgi:hypothetical protein